jgi:hypothetical protein
MEKTPTTISIGFMLDAAIANASKARGLKTTTDSDDLSTALEAAEDAFDVAAEKLRIAHTLSEKIAA